MQAVKKQYGITLSWTQNLDIRIEQDEMGEQVVIVTPDSVPALIASLQRFVSERPEA